MKAYMVMGMITFVEHCDGDGTLIEKIPLNTGEQGVVGAFPAFESREAAERYAPGLPVVEMTGEPIDGGVA